MEKDSSHNWPMSGGVHIMIEKPLQLACKMTSEKGAQTMLHVGSSADVGLWMASEKASGMQDWQS